MLSDAEKDEITTDAIDGCEADELCEREALVRQVEADVAAGRYDPTGETLDSLRSGCAPRKPRPCDPDTRSLEGTVTTTLGTFLTPRQQEAFDAMLAIHRRTGNYVTTTELGTRLGVTRVSAWDLIQRLARLGRIKSFRCGGVLRYVPIVKRSGNDVVGRAVSQLRKRGEEEIAHELEQAFAE